MAVNDELIFDPINRFIWSIVIFLLFICSFIFSRASYKMDKERQSQEIYNNKMMFLGVGTLIMGLSLSRLFFFISDFFRNGYYIGHSYYALEGGDAFLYNQLGMIGTICFVVGNISFYYFLNKISTKLFYIPIITNILLIFWIYFGIGIQERIPTYIAVLMNSILIIIILIKNSKQGSKQLQIISHFLLMGISLYIIGSAFDSGLIGNLDLIISIAPAVFMIFGILITMVSVFYLPKTYSNLKKLLKIISILFLGVLSFSIYLSLKIIIELTENIFVIVTYSLVITIILVIFPYSIFRFYYSLKILERVQDNNVDFYKEDLLGLFLYNNRFGEIKYTRDLDANYYNIIDQLEWENLEEKNEFLEYIFSIPPIEREKIFNDFVNKKKSINN